jgi:amino acid transporter
VETVQSEQRHLKKELSIWQVVGLSVALMAPSMAANINPQGSASAAGRAVPLTFLFAAIGIMFIAYVFVRLTQHFNHAGSVFGFVGATIGPRSGVIAGWSLMGTYISYALVTSIASSIFATSLLQSLGVMKNPPSWTPFLIQAIELSLVLMLAVRPAKKGTHFLLSVEGLTVLMIVAISVVILIKLIVGHGPQGQHFTLSVFTPAKGVTSSDLFLGVVFGFLSFAGFEASATLGEEAKHPKKDIPRAILWTAVFGGIYFVFVTSVEVMGFGTSPKQINSFINTGSLLGFLGSTYVASWIGNLITVGTVISAFGCALASTVGASRLLFALNRDSVETKPLLVISRRYDTPTVATAAVVAFTALVTWFVAVILGSSAFDEFNWFGTIGTLILLVVYLLATAGAFHLLFISKKLEVPKYEMVMPIMAIAILGYTIFRNVYPYPTGALAWLPAASAGWILVSLVVVVLRPKLAKKAGLRLTQNEGLIPQDSAYELDHGHEALDLETR